MNLIISNYFLIKQLYIVKFILVEYCSLIKKYLNRTIPPHKFRARFLEMVKQDDEKAEKILQDFKQLASFSIDVNLDGFSSLFGRISNNCLQAFEFGPKNDG